MYTAELVDVICGKKCETNPNGISGLEIFVG
jgi:hypothetical protein